MSEGAWVVRPTVPRRARRLVDAAAAEATAMRVAVTVVIVAAGLVIATLGLLLATLLVL